MQAMKKHVQPWLRLRRARGECGCQRQDTDDLTQDAPSDQQCFLNAVALPAGAWSRVCFRLHRAFPSRSFPPEKFLGDLCVAACSWRIDTWADFAGNRAAKVRCVSLSERTWGQPAATKNANTG